MFHRPLSRRRACLLLLALSVVLAAPLRAQQRDGGVERPRVDRIRFDGADALTPGMLRGAIVTEETRCRGFLLQPFCWITDWRLIHERHYLDPEELPRDELRLRVFYARRGYREAQVGSEVRPNGRGVEVVFHIEEGEPTLIQRFELSQTERVLNDRQIRRAGLPGEGEPLNLVQLDTALAHLAARLGERGFLDAVIHDTVEVFPLQRQARVEVRVEPGPRTTVGEVDIRGNEDVADRTISNALRLPPGRVLRTTDIAASQRSLYESNLFHEARVSVPEQPDSAKRVEIVVREAPPRSARVGGGFNTLEFVQAEARFTHFDWLGGGRRLDLRGTVGNLLAEQLNGRGIFREVVPPDVAVADRDRFFEPTWLVSADLMQPAFRAAANRAGFSLFSHRRIIPAIAIDEGYGADLSLTRQLDHGVPATVSYRFERSQVEAGDLYFCVNFAICDLPTIATLQAPHNLSPARFGFFVERADNPLSPTRGWRARVDLEHAAGYTGSDFHYHRASGEISRYWPMDVRRRTVLAGRVRTGWVRPLGSTDDALGINGAERAILHPRKRFYAGGSRSVRGYGENQLGPRVLTIDPAELTGANGEGPCSTAQIADGSCDPNADGVDPAAFRPRPLGGTSVLELSVEYRFPFLGPLIGAVFVDGAVVGERADLLFQEGTAAVSPGFGVRYRSPVGPIRVDLGIRPTPTERLPVFTEVFENGERRLVRLDEPREYNPLDAVGGGFLRQTLARLTLHLSVGEAF
jgi:outer membrane protein insertion porin family